MSAESIQGTGGDVELLERAPFAEALAESLVSASLGEGRLMLVSGEAGIGKSTLVRRFCAARTGDARVLWGACDALQTPLPLSPLIDIAEVVGGDLLTCIQHGGKPHAVFVALTEELRTAKPTIAVLEDVHWADEATLDIVRLLARRAESLGALVIVTYREDELDAKHPLRLAVGELGTAPGVVQLRLPALSREAVEELADPDGVDAGELYERTAGNPFFVTEVLAGGGAPVPPTVRDAVLARVNRLGSGAQGVLEAVAVVSPAIDMWLLEEVVPDEAVHVDACLAAGILRAEGRTVAFRHELARLAVEESIGAHRRTVLHRRMLAALRNPSEGAPDPARLAHHAEAAGDADAVLEYATAAATRAAAQGAHREAAAQYARAVRFAGGLPLRELAELLQRQAHECYLTDQIDDAVAALERALGCHRARGDRRSEAEALCELSAILWCPGRIAESERAGAEAVEVLAGLDPGRELALAYANLSNLALWEDAAAAIAWATRAAELAARLGEAEILLHARANIALLQYARGTLANAAPIERVQQMAAQAGLESEVGRIWTGLGWCALSLRAWDALDRYTDAGISHCAERDLEMYQRYLHTDVARGALERARWDEATAAATVILHDPGPSIVPRMHAHVVLALVQARRGDPHAPESLAAATALAEQQGQLHALALAAAARAELAWLAGKSDEILAITAAAVDLAARRDAAREFGELSRWRWRAGVREHAPLATGPDAATLAGDWELAARLWAELGCPYEAAMALGDSDDDDALARGLAELHRLGARPAAAVLTQRLRERGVRRVPRGPYRTARENPASLTARELEVLALLAEGLRNSEIAARLVVSQRTVDHHVSAVLRKLGAHTRGEAAAIAVRDGLTAKAG